MTELGIYDDTRIERDNVFFVLQLNLSITFADIVRQRKGGVTEKRKKPLLLARNGLPDRFFQRGDQFV